MKFFQPKDTQKYGFYYGSGIKDQECFIKSKTKKRSDAERAERVNNLFKKCFLPDMISIYQSPKEPAGPGNTTGLSNPSLETLATPK